jgi:hypothetical protein
MAGMRYLTTLDVARQIGVSKQTLLNWLYDRKVPEPPRNKKGYRLWSESRINLVKRLIRDGRLRRRTVVHEEPSNRPDVIVGFAREVSQFLEDSQAEPAAFLRELVRLAPGLRPYVRLGRAARATGVKRPPVRRKPR